MREREREREREKARRVKHARVPFVPDQSSIYPVCWCARERVTGDGGHVSTGFQPRETREQPLMYSTLLWPFEPSLCLQSRFDENVTFYGHRVEPGN